MRMWASLAEGRKPTLRLPTRDVETITVRGTLA
jgi:hypothetical protein